MKTKIGIADAHGVESYIDKTASTAKEFNMFALRASLNRQRHAVAYEAQVTNEDDAKINALLKQDEYVNALTMLKKVAINIKLATDMGDVNTSWNLIPNHKLDPYN